MLRDGQVNTGHISGPVWDLLDDMLRAAGAV